MLANEFYQRLQNTNIANGAYTDFKLNQLDGADLLFGPRFTMIKPEVPEVSSKKIG